MNSRLLKVILPLDVVGNAADFVALCLLRAAKCLHDEVAIIASTVAEDHMQSD